MIENAFAKRPYPGDGRIADAGSRYPDYEGHRVSAFRRGKNWRGVALRSLLDGYPGDPVTCLWFMLDEGFRYYLPAFLLMALDPQAGEITEPGSRQSGAGRPPELLGAGLLVNGVNDHRRGIHGADTAGATIHD